MGERTDQQEEEAARSGEEGTGKETETNEEEGNCGKGEKGRNGKTSVAEREQKIEKEGLEEKEERPTPGTKRRER